MEFKRCILSINFMQNTSTAFEAIVIKLVKKNRNGYEKKRNH